MVKIVNSAFLYISGNDKAESPAHSEVFSLVDGKISIIGPKKVNTSNPKMTFKNLYDETYKKSISQPKPTISEIAVIKNKQILK